MALEAFGRSQPETFTQHRQVNAVLLGPGEDFCEGGWLRHCLQHGILNV